MQLYLHVHIIAYFVTRILRFGGEMNRILNSILWVCLLVGLKGVAYTQSPHQLVETISLSGIVKTESGSPAQTKIDLYQNGKKLRTVYPNPSGRYELELNYQSDYELVYTSEGNVSKRMLVNTETSGDDDEYDIPTLNFNIELPKATGGPIDEAYAQPVSRLFINEELETFDRDAKVEQQFKNILKQKTGEQKKWIEEQKALEEQKKKEAEELRKAEELARRQALEEARAAELQKQKAEADRLKQEEEAARKAREEALKAEEERKKREMEEQDRLAKEAYAQKQAQEAAKKQALEEKAKADLALAEERRKAEEARKEEEKRKAMSEAEALKNARLQAEAEAQRKAELEREQIEANRLKKEQDAKEAQAIAEREAAEKEAERLRKLKELKEIEEAERKAKLQAEQEALSTKKAYENKADEEMTLFFKRIIERGQRNQSQILNKAQEKEAAENSKLQKRTTQYLDEKKKMEELAERKQAMVLRQQKIAAEDMSTKKANEIRQGKQDKFAKELAEREAKRQAFLAEKNRKEEEAEKQRAALLAEAMKKGNKPILTVFSFYDGKYYGTVNYNDGKGNIPITESEFKQIQSQMENK